MAIKLAVAILGESHSQRQSHKASISRLKTQFESEKSELLTETPGLRYKVLYPTNLERQKVSLVSGIFNDKTIETLMAKPDKVAKETAEFINVILSWWKIMNVKRAHKGVRLRDDLCLPFREIDDCRIQFLKNFVDWLKMWHRLQEKEKSGCLTKQTFRALTHTTTTMCKLFFYAKAVLSFDYILLGKVQTDNLERRLGLYRQLCGANYHVSVAQVLEAEKKLRVSSLLSIRSSKHGTINVRYAKSLRTRTLIATVAPLPIYL